MLTGLKRHGWDSTSLVTAETEGADCFARARAAGGPVRLDAITSVATSLGALECSPTALELAASHPTRSAVVTDAEAIDACLRLADDHRTLVEPACGAALALLYSERHRGMWAEFEDVVVVVCGGGGVDLALLKEWSRLANKGG